MKKTTLLGIGIVLLLVINAATLGYVYFTTKNHPPHRPENKQVIAEILHFDAGQRQQYEEKIVWHRGRIHQLDSRIREQKAALYSLLVRDAGTAKKDSIITIISGLNNEIEQTHYKHFEDIRSICKPGQMVYYKQLVFELPQLFGPKKPHPKD